MGTFIRHIAVWLSRIAYCRGFGIQSPSAYAFVRYVINEHYPYYAYEQLGCAGGSLSRADRKRMRLCLRVANHLQPQYIVDQQDGLSQQRRQYFEAGCRSAQYLRLTDGLSAQVQKASRLIRVSATATDAATISRLYTSADSHTLLIIDHIAHDRNTRQLWRQVVADPHTGVSYDLYYCGIVCFDRSKYKRNYKINF